MTFDDALCGTCFATLACEVVDRQRCATPAEARLTVFDFSEGWYTPRRRHSALDHLAPTMFERAYGPDVGQLQRESQVTYRRAQTSSLTG